MSSSPDPADARRVLAVDVGGSHVKLLVQGAREKRRFESGPELSPEEMVAGVLAQARGWSFDVVALGYPGPVLDNSPIAEPVHLGEGWVGFDYEAAFDRPVRIVNDAAMQALGSYEGGRMLFLGLGTGLGTALVVEGVLVPMEFGHMHYKKGKSYEDYLGKRGLKRLGVKRWRESVMDVVERLRKALAPTDVVLGGGNVKKLDDLPPGARRGDNENAFLGGFRLWERDEGAREPKRAAGESGA